MTETEMCGRAGRHGGRRGDLRPGFLRCSYYEDLQSFSSLSSLSRTHCSPVTHTDVKTNTQINRRKQTHTHTHTLETWTPTTSLLLSKSCVPPTLPPIFLVSSRPPALHEFLLNKTLSRLISHRLLYCIFISFFLSLGCSPAPPCPQFHCFILSFTSSCLPDAYPTSSLYFLPAISLFLFFSAVLPSFPFSLVSLSFSQFPQASFSCQS